MKNVVIVLTLLLFVSCAEEMIKKPENLIPKEKMSDILYDLALLNAAKNTNSQKLREYSIETMPYIYKKYNIDSTQFVESDRYYTSIPLDYEAIYTTVEKRLEKEKTRLDSLTYKKPGELSKNPKGTTKE